MSAVPPAASDAPDNSAPPAARADALAVVLIYAIFAALWILLSDYAVAWLFADPAAIVIASTVKGWLFVGVTSVLLYGLIRRLVGGHLAPGSTPVGVRPWLAFLVMAGMLSAVTGTLIGDTTRDAIWISLSGMLALFMVGAGLIVLRQRQALLVAQTTQQAQAERLRALHLLAAIAEASDDAIFAKDLEGRYILFNRAAGKFAGKAPEVVLGQDDRFLFPAQQAEMLMADDRRTIANNLVHVQEERLETAVGTRVFSATKGPLRNSDGVIIGTFGNARDITEQDRAAQALREAEEFKRAILDSVDAQIAVLDPQGFIVDVNRPWQRFAAENGPAPGKPAQHTEVGVNYIEVCEQSVGVSSEGALAARDGIRAVLASQLPCFRLEYPCHSPTQQRWFSMTATPLGDKRRGVVIVHSDITARKTAEAALHRQAEELLSRNAELERFNRATVGRELDMITLKQRVNELSTQLGQAPPYPLQFLEDEAPSRKGEAPS